MTLNTIIDTARSITQPHQIYDLDPILLRWIACFSEHPLANLALETLQSQHGVKVYTIKTITKPTHNPKKVKEVLAKMSKYPRKFLEKLVKESNSELWRDCATQMLAKK